MKKLVALVVSMILVLSIAGCSTETQTTDSGSDTTQVVVTNDGESTGSSDSGETGSAEASTESGSDGSSFISGSATSILDTTDMFSDRDLEQEADLTEAVHLTLEDGTDYLINEEGVYVISGDVTDSMIQVEVDDEAKVQIVLDGVTVVNDSKPFIYVVEADKVWVTTTDSENYLEVSGEYVADGETNLDAVIFSKADLVLNGLGSLEVVSVKGNGITSKDDLKVTGGTLVIESKADGLEANDSVRIYAGELTIDSDKDAIHSENDEDDTLGYIYIYGGTLNIAAGDDAVRGTSIVQIDGGTINIETCVEGIEGTYVQINGGDITIYSTDDGVNATAKSSLDVVIEINGGTIDVTMASGDTDGFDSNGNLYVNGGTITFSGGSSFDADGIAELNGGDVTVNGEVITEITSQHPMGGAMDGQMDNPMDRPTDGQTGGPTGGRKH
jgi:hypothetical protein